MIEALAMETVFHVLKLVPAAVTTLTNAASAIKKAIYSTKVSIKS